MTQTGKQTGIEFNCLGGSVKIRHGYKTDENGDKVKMYFTKSDIEKLKLPEKFLAKRKNGLEIGIIELDMNRQRKLIVDRREKEMIELLKSNELVSKQGSAQRLTNKISWYDAEEEKIERQVKVQGRQVALLVVSKFTKEDLKDLTLCLGIKEVDVIHDADFADIIDNKPDRILNLIETVKSEKGVPTSKGVLESTRIEAVLRRAISKNVVVVRSGAIFFNDEQIGVDFKNALKNLQNKTKGDDTSFNHIVPLIKAKLEE